MARSEWDEIVEDLIARLRRQGLSEYEAANEATRMVRDHWRSGMDAGDVLASETRAQRAATTATSTQRAAARQGLQAAQQSATDTIRALGGRRITSDSGPSGRSRRERSTHQRVVASVLRGVDASLAFNDDGTGVEPGTFADERIVARRGDGRLRRRNETVTDETAYLHPGRRPGDRVSVNRPQGPTYTTPRAAIAAMYELEEDDLRRLQFQLWEAGFYGDGRPAWGILGQSDLQAYTAFFAFMADHSGESVEGALRLAAERNISMRGAGVAADAGEGEFGSAAPTFVAELTDPDRLRQVVDTVGQRLFGANIDPAVREQLVADINARDEAEQRRRFEFENRGELAAAEATASGMREPGDPPEEELQRFLAALSGQESGGDPNAVNARTGAHGRFQILPGNWEAWARRAGLPGNAPRTAANQEIVARRIVSDYYRQFGNWRDVAIAWYAGPGAAADPSSRDRNRGHGPSGREPSINRYADEVMARLGAATKGDIKGDAAYAEAAFTMEDPEASIEAELRRRDPAGFAATQYAGQAREFFGLLQGVGI